MSSNSTIDGSVGANRARAAKAVNETLVALNSARKSMQELYELLTDIIALEKTITPEHEISIHMIRVIELSKTVATNADVVTDLINHYGVQISKTISITSSVGIDFDRLYPGLNTNDFYLTWTSQGNNFELIQL